MSFFKHTVCFKQITPKILILILIFPIFFLARPQKTHAQFEVQDFATEINTGATAGTDTTNTGLTLAEKIKSYVLDPLAVVFAHQIVQKLTAQTVNWINSGFNGNPAYVTDPGQFFLGVADNTTSAYLSSNAFLNSLCAPFSANIRLALVKNYLAQTTNSSCTLGAIANNYNSFMTNFSNGGWDSWFSITQNSQNNPYGAYIYTSNQMLQQQANQVNKYQQQLNQGNGFLSYEKCNPNGATTVTTQKGVSGGETGPSTTFEQAYEQCATSQGTPQCTSDDTSAECQVTNSICVASANAASSQSSSGNSSYNSASSGAQTTCAPQDEQIVTPGSVISTQLAKALPAGFDQLQMTTSINQIVSALLTQMFTDVVGGGTNGLRGLSQSSGVSTNGAGTASLTQQVLNPTSVGNTGTQNQVIQGILNTTAANLKSSQPTSPGSPIIILNPPNPATADSIADFVDPGAEAYDASGNDISSSITTTLSAGAVASNGLQTYTVSYDVTDSQGNKANTVTRTVQVTPPPTNTTPTGTPPFTGTPPAGTPGTSGTPSGTTYNGPLGLVSSSPVAGVGSIPIFASGGVSVGNFTTAAPDPASGAACTANLTSQFSANPGDPFVDGRVESLTYCGVCASTAPLMCDQTHYKNCSISFTNTTDQSCIAPPAGTTGTTKSTTNTTSTNTSTNTSGTSGTKILYSNTTPLTFSANQGGSPAATQALVVQNGAASGTTIQWTAKKTQSWLSISPSGPANLGGGGQGVFPTVSVSSASLARGTYTDTITITAFDTTTNQPTNTVTVPVTLTIN